jgi:hypothetical protein
MPAEGSKLTIHGSLKIKTSYSAGREFKQKNMLKDEAKVYFDFFCVHFCFPAVICFPGKQFRDPREDR